MPLTFIKPQLPTLVNKAPDGDGWIHEVKFDGYRTQLILEGGRARTLTKTGIDWTSKYSLIAEAAEIILPGRTFILDGEVYLPDGRGAADFEGLPAAIKRQPEALIFAAFDLLHLDGEDFRGRPVEERRVNLEALLASGLHASNIQFSHPIEASGPEAFAAVERLGLEGIVSKRLGSRHRSGDSRDWLKTKCFVTESLEIIGVDRTAKRGIPEVLLSREGRYAGRAVLSLPSAERDVFWRFVELYAQPTPTVPVGDITATWLPAGPRAKIKHLRGTSRLLRHASFVEFDLETAS